MILLDMRTLVFSNVVIDIVCMLVILLLWHQSRKRFAGADFWAFDFAFQTAAMFLITMRGSIPDLMSMLLSNTLVIGGAILGYMGLGRFVGKKISQVHNYVLLAVFACVHSYFILVQPNLAARNINVSVGLLIICFQCMWFLVYRVEPGMRPLTLGVGMVFGAYCLVSMVRIIGVIIGAHPASDFFHSGAFESLIFTFYQILFILLTYTLVLMVNKRLFLEVKTQEEKFAKAFQSSPDAITLTRLSDGQIVEVNDSFLNISGYQYAEAVGKTTVDLHFWDKEEDRWAVVNELSESGKVRGREFQFRKKSGEMITGLFSADIIPINNQEFVLSSINDVTERKRMEDELRRSRDELDMRVQERTEELQAINEQLRVENEERLRIEIELRESENRLRELSGGLLSAQERERKLIAGEIHDGLGASLAATKFKVEAALKKMDDNNPQTRVVLESVVPIVQGTIEEARRIQMSLRPSMLDDLGILATINWFCRQFESTYSNIHIKREIDIQEHEVPESLKIVIYRVLQEALNNIAKHSKADRVNLLLRKKDKAIELAIQDNGQGFDLSEAQSRIGTGRRLGLVSIRERADLSGGSLSIESGKGTGTVIRAAWPLNR
jgi:PAS domain S-box-containing protein